MTPKAFITTAEVAGLLEIDTAHFNTQRRHLIDTCGFPQPMPFRGPQGATIWRRKHVEAWVADQGLPKDMVPEAAPERGVVLRLVREAQA